MTASLSRVAAFSRTQKKGNPDVPRYSAFFELSPWTSTSQVLLRDGRLPSTFLIDNIDLQVDVGLPCWTPAGPVRQPASSLHSKSRRCCCCRRLEILVPEIKKQCYFQFQETPKGVSSFLDKQSVKVPSHRIEVTICGSPPRLVGPPPSHHTHLTSSDDSQLTQAPRETSSTAPPHSPKQPEPRWAN